VDVLPAPFGPSSAQIWPDSTVKVSPLTACRRPYRLDSSRALIAAPGGFGARKLARPADTAGEAADRHRTMQITDAGRAALRAELEQMARVSQAGLRALGTTPA
jgi:hypothetical protein